MLAKCRFADVIFSSRFANLSQSMQLDAGEANRSWRPQLHSLT
jgi:hypothetical protein